MPNSRLWDFEELKSLVEKKKSEEGGKKIVIVGMYEPILTSSHTRRTQHTLSRYVPGRRNIRTHLPSPRFASISTR